MERRAFDIMFNGIATRWNIPVRKTNHLIKQYTWKLVDELLDLGRDPMELPSYLRDRRTPEQYLYDILYGWCSEDLTILWLNERGVKANLNGNDKDRVVQKKHSKFISTSADLICGTQPVELKVSREARPDYDVKVGNINKAIKNGQLILFVDMEKNQYFIIDPARDVYNKKPYNNPSYGGKPCYNWQEHELEMIDMKAKIPYHYWVMLDGDNSKSNV